VTRQGILDLTGASVSQRGDDVVFTWRMKGRVPRTDTALWSALLSSADGSTSRQIGYKPLDGVQSAYFVFDMSTAKQVEAGGHDDGNYRQVSRCRQGSRIGLEVDRWRESRWGTTSTRSAMVTSDLGSRRATRPGPRKLTLGSSDCQRATCHS
jgi:hypothetical protein